MVLRNIYCDRCYRLLRLGDDTINFGTLTSWHEKCANRPGFVSREFTNYDRWLIAGT